MSWPLFRANIRNCRFLWLLLTAIFLMYMVMIVSIFDPAMTDTINDMLKLMPETFVSALGFDNTGTTLLTFVAGYMYSMLLFLFPMILTIVVNHRLVASHVDKGSMAFLLATPNTRIRIVLTQAIFSLSSTVLFFTVATLGGLLASAAIFPGELDMGEFVMLNLYAMLMYTAIGGICFLASCLADDSRTSLGLGAGIPILFIVMQMLGNADKSLEGIGRLSLYALFDPYLLFERDPFAYIGMFAFGILALALYSAGIIVFHRKNLYI